MTYLLSSRLHETEAENFRRSDAMQAESENHVRKQAQYLGRPVFLTTKMSSSGKSSSERMLFAK